MMTSIDRGVVKPALNSPMLLMASGIDHDPLPEDEVGTCHIYRKGEKITVLTPENIRDVTELGFQVFQLAAGPHFNQDIGPDGRGNWGPLDAHLEMLARLEVRALLVTGFYWMAPWMNEDPRAVPLRCRQHDRAIPILSLWSPFTLEWIERCVTALADHLRDRLDLIHAFGLILYGDFGEAIFPAGMLTVGSEKVRDPVVVGMHNHGDFWCNDPSARAAYVEFLRRRYPDAPAVSRLDPGDPNLFPVCPAENEPLRPWLDFLEWYYAGMTDYARKVVGIYRKCFPHHPISIWLGGGVEAHTYGQDNTGLPRAMKPLRATIRSTASAAWQVSRQVLDPGESVAWGFQKNYPVVKRIATACRFYDVPLWFEPPYPPGLDERGLVARIFEAVSCGSVGYFEWTRTLQRHKPVYRKFRDLLRKEVPRVAVGVYFPLLSHRATADSLFPKRFWTGAAQLRAVIDYDVVDDRLIRDGILDQYRVLVCPELEWIEGDILHCIRRWVEQGGMIIAQDSGPIRTPETPAQDEREWFGAIPPSAAGSEGVAGARRDQGKGFSLFCAETGETPTTLVKVARDVLLHHPTLPPFVRVLTRWPDESGRIFATCLGNRVLLANLSPETVVRQNGNQIVTLDPFDITTVALDDDSFEP